MRPTVEYKGWKAWGKIGLLRHVACKRRVSPPGNYTCKVYVTRTKEVHVCTACGMYITPEIENHFRALHNLLVKSGM